MNQASSDLSVTTLAGVLASLDGSDWFHQRGAPQRWTGIMSWKRLLTILGEHRLSSPQLRLVKSGHLLPPSTYLRVDRARRGESYTSADAERLISLLRDGAMLHLAGVDRLHRPLSDLARSVEEATGSRCFVNLHAGLHASRGFDVHYDGHEVCVLQIEGRKEWRIYGTTIEAPLAVPPNEKRNAPSEILWTGMIERGDLLYVPRGCWHAAAAVAGPSLHLSVGWENPTAGEFLDWSLARARSQLAFRRDGPGLQRRADADAFLGNLALPVEGLLSNDLYQEFLTHRRQDALASRSAFLLPEVDSADDGGGEGVYD